MSMKKSNDTIGNQTSDLPACSAMPHSLAVLRKTKESTGFCNGENEICFRVEFYTAQNGSFLTTFRDTLSVTLSRVKQPLEPIG
jgi:hypothetical protein